MNNLIWLLVYLVVGAIYGCWVYGEEDTPGMVFLETFCWPLPAIWEITHWLMHCIVDIVDMVFELLEPEDEE